jgi:hypothetical protein
MLAALLAGCGESGNDDGTQPETRRTTESTAPETGSETKPDAPRGDEVKKDGKPIEPKVIETPGGGTITIPPAPRATRVAPGPGCAERPAGRPAPPRAGIQAETSSETVFLEYEFPEGTARCRPEFLRITLATSDGAAPSISKTHPIAKLSSVLELPIPANFPEPPDTITVAAVMPDGQVGPRSSVRPR